MFCKLDSSLFDWLTWLRGSPADLIGCSHCRSDDFRRWRHTLREYAIGYCDAEGAPCRPKREHKCVMFSKNGVEFWFHLVNKEFNIVFKEVI